MPDTPQIDYLCHAYRQQLPVWELLDAVYHGDRAWLDYSNQQVINWRPIEWKRGATTRATGNDTPLETKRNVPKVGSFSCS